MPAERSRPTRAADGTALLTLWSSRPVPQPMSNTRSRGANPAQVLAVLNGTADMVSNMRVRRPNLGDLFLKLTGEALPVTRR